MRRVGHKVYRFPLQARSHLQGEGRVRLSMPHLRESQERTVGRRVEKGGILQVSDNSAREKVVARARGRARRDGKLASKVGASDDV